MIWHGNECLSPRHPSGISCGHAGAGGCCGSMGVQGRNTIRGGVTG